MQNPWKDPVVEEVRDRGRDYVARHGNSIHRVFEDLREHQREHLERYVSQLTVVSVPPSTESSGAKDV